MSHVLPECFGNTEQVLPPGIVCYSCNHYFGDKIEPALFEDPVIHTMCVMFHIVDPGDGKVFRERLFNRHHIPADLPRLTPQLDLTVRSNAFEFAVACEEVGIKETHHKEHKRRNVARFSRAIHKVAFESFVCYQLEADPKPSGIDLFAEQFEPIRRWTRCGHPHGKVRPLARMVSPHIAPEWRPEVIGFDQHLALQLRLFADWFAVSLTSPQAQVREHLRRWYSNGSERIWLIADDYGRLNAGDGGKPV